MNPLLRYAEILEDVEALQALGYIAPIRCFEEAEAAFDALGPGDENANEDEIAYPPEEDEDDTTPCGDPTCPWCDHEFVDEYSHPPTDEDRKARETWDEGGS